MSGESRKQWEIIAAQLIEAARSALGGDADAVKDHVARVNALVRAEVRSAPVVVRTPGNPVQPRGGLTAWQLRSVMEHVDANITRRIRVSDLSQIVKLSEGHFGREFKRSFGVTAHAYLTLRRIEISQGLMLATASPLSDIALRCGMSDQSHFSRAFRRLIGETPNAWRRSRLEMSVMGSVHRPRSGKRPERSLSGNRSSSRTVVTPGR
jgi:AraC-like DNA-binding protein